MPLRLTLLAHAATSAQIRGIFADPEDPIAPMPPQGGSVDADIVWCSPARAARDTAAALGLQPITHDALRDRDAGEWRGMALAAVKAQAPERLAAWLGDPDARAPGGESANDVARRVGPWLDGLAGDERLRGTILAVTHAAVIRAAVMHVLGAPADAGPAIDIAPLTATRLSYHGRWRLQAMGVPWNTLQQ